MTLQTINIGAAPNDGTGDSLRVTGGKLNANFTALLNAFGGNDAAPTLASSFVTTNTGSADAGKWTKFATVTLSTVGSSFNLLMSLLSSYSSIGSRAEIRGRQFSNFGTNASISTRCVYDAGSNEDIGYVVVSNVGPSVIDLYVKNEGADNAISGYQLARNVSNSAQVSVVFHSLQPYVTTPAGLTQTVPKALSFHSQNSVPLNALHGLTPAADRLAYFDSSNTAALTTLTTFGRSLIDDVDALTARATLGLVKTTSSTDTTSGSMLKVGDFGIGSSGGAPSVTDANSATTAGFYKLGSPFTNGPTAAAYTIFVQRYDNEVTQMAALEGASTTVMWIRKRAGASTWGPWSQLLQNGDAPVTAAGSTVELTSVDVLDINRQTGVYQFQANCTNLPVSGVGIAALIVRRTSAPAMTITAFTNANPQMWTNTYQSGAWSGWKQVIRSGEFGIGGSTAALTAPDLNTVTNCGMYYVSNPTNSPTGEIGGGWLTVEWTNSLYIAQTYTSNTLLSNHRWMRVCQNGTWAPWRKFIHEGSIYGTVSQVSGVPTGAVIEKGSNANGSYTRWADGTQICEISFNSDATNLYTVGSALWGSNAIAGGNFPASFIATPVVTSGCTKGTSNSAVFASCYNAWTVTSWGLWRGMSADNAAGAATIHLIAKGRWF